MREIKFTALYNEHLYFVSTLQPNHKVQGYVRRKVKNHPFADKRGYVSEHRLVMEEHLERFLKDDEIVHHKNHVRDDNHIENLELLTDQKRHAAGHAASMVRDKDAQTWVEDTELSKKKFRLLNKNTGLMEVKNLSQLINTTFRKSQFDYRGEWTGLKDKNGKEIYEGDIYKTPHSELYYVISFVNGYFGGAVAGITPSYPIMEPDEDGEFLPLDWVEVIGNIWESPELLEES